jgi:hypothetical protein
MPVTEEGSSSPEMKDLTSTSFGYLIGFLLPGIFGLYALSYWFPEVGVLLQPVLKADASVGPSVVFLLIAVGMGLLVSALRFVLFERFLCRKHHLPANSFALLTAEGKLSSFKAVVDEHYRYHQFYGGCGVVTLALFAGWLRGHLELNWRVACLSVGFVSLELLLVASGRDSFIKYVQRGRVVIAPTSTPTNTQEEGVESEMTNGWRGDESHGEPPVRKTPTRDSPTPPPAPTPPAPKPPPPPKK